MFAGPHKTSGPSSSFKRGRLTLAGVSSVLDVGDTEAFFMSLVLGSSPPAIRNS